MYGFLYLFLYKSIYLRSCITFQLDFKGIEVTSVSVQFQNKADGTAKNEFNTFFDTTDIDLYRGLDFVPKGHVFYKVTHLDHKPYSIKLEVRLIVKVLLNNNMIIL